MVQQSDFKVNMMCGTLEKAYGHCQGLNFIIVSSKPDVQKRVVSCYTIQTIFCLILNFPHNFSWKKWNLMQNRSEIFPEFVIYIVIPLS